MEANYIPGLDPKPYKPRCQFGHGHIWIFIDADADLCQCSKCGCMSSNWQASQLPESVEVPAEFSEQAKEEFDALIAEGYLPSMIRYRFIDGGYYRVAGYKATKHGVTVGCDRFIGRTS